MMLLPRQLLRFNVELPIEPPSSTHHDKVIRVAHPNARRRPGKPFRKAWMQDSPELEAARDLIAKALQYTGKRPPRPLGEAPGKKQPGCPLAIGLEFICGGAQRWSLNDQKPDFDNLMKTTVDVLAKSGWIKDDKKIAIVGGGKWNRPGKGMIGIWCAELDPDMPPPELSLVFASHVPSLGPTVEDLL